VRAEESVEVRITVAGYAALPEVYEWLMPDTKLSPAGSVAEFADVVQPLPPNARVLDCSCGTGQLAVGLAGLGLDVVASDASSGMVRRTRELAEEHHVSLRALWTTRTPTLSRCCDALTPTWRWRSMPCQLTRSGRSPSLDATR
jgi:SAM-dependent methyltransferase